MGEEGEDYGLFGPGSVTWKVHVEQVLWVGGFRALLLQSLHPRVMRGTYQNSALFDRKKSWERFLRTARFVTLRSFGSTEAVERYAARVRALHSRLSGFDPDTGETFPLDEPAGLLWVHCAEIDSYASVSRRAGVIDAREEDRYIDENRRAAEVVGLSPDDVPANRADLDAYFDEIRPRLYACDEAKKSLLNVVNPPTPLKLAPLRLFAPTMLALSMSSLPGWARRLYGLPGAPITDFSTTVALQGLRRATLPLRNKPLDLRQRVQQV
ncbi:oxygenase MpaB family protein [Flindersiella endophytica]